MAVSWKKSPLAGSFIFESILDASNASMMTDSKCLHAKAKVGYATFGVG
jgi:hypothetical protein